jgi:ABC-type thiamin/hydroxymethylpyrimidine transport system permease subunit
MSQWLQDLDTASGMIAGSFFIAFFFGYAYETISYRLLYMVLVRYFSGLIVWISIIGYFIGLIILASFCYDKSLYYKQ